MRKLFLLSIAIVLCGCATPRPEVNSISDAIVVTSADVEIAAATIRSLCGSTVRQGDCRAGAPITTETKNRLRDRLREVVDTLERASIALAARDSVAANNRVSRARILLNVLRSELRRLEN